MATTAADLRGFFNRYRMQSEAVGVALLAIAVALTLGTMARRQATPLNAERDRLRSATRELNAFRTGFQAATPREDSAQFADSLAIGIARDVRFSLAQQVALRAEQSGLRDVRIRFAAADTAAPPQAPDFTGRSVAIADYTVALDCAGGYASMLEFVRRLPVSVAVQRISATRTSTGGVEYHIVLAVFESSAEAAAHG